MCRQEKNYQRLKLSLPDRYERVQTGLNNNIWSNWVNSRVQSFFFRHTHLPCAASVQRGYTSALPSFAFPLVTTEPCHLGQNISCRRGRCGYQRAKSPTPHGQVVLSFMHMLFILEKSSKGPKLHTGISSRLARLALPVPSSSPSRLLLTLKSPSASTASLQQTAKCLMALLQYLAPAVLVHH